MQYIRLVIAGGRDFNNYQTVADNASHLLDKLKVNPDEVILICGMAPGADTLGLTWAQNHGIKVESYPADWGLYGKSAGPIRNREMAQVATHLLAFWDGESKGTKNMIEMAHLHGVQTIIITY